MTSLTDKMEGLMRKESDHHHCKYFNDGVAASIALAKAEEAVVGDWEAGFTKKWLQFSSEGGFNKDNGIEHELVLKWLTNLLAAKDREIEDKETETLQEVMDWAMDYGITDKKSFCALRDYLTEKALPLTK